MRSSPASAAGARRSGRSCTAFRRSSASSTTPSTAEIALIENIQREDLNAIEEAEGYQAADRRPTAIARTKSRKLVGKSRSHVANLLRLLDFPRTFAKCCCEAISAWAMRGPSPTSPEARAIWRARSSTTGFASARPKQLAERPSRPARPRHRPRRRATPRPVDADLAALERQLGDLLGLQGQGRAWPARRDGQRCIIRASTSST